MSKIATMKTSIQNRRLTARMRGSCLVATFILAGATASAATLYVWQSSPSPAPPYATWATAAANIQDAIDAASNGDEVLVTNGVYETGARTVYGMSNRVAVTRAVTVRSVNGPDAAVIRGYQAPGWTNGIAAIR